MKIEHNKIEDIIKMSETMKQSEIAKIFNVSQSLISKLLLKNNIKSIKSRLNLSKLKFNYNYFDVIDTSKKAYWIGFISADGCLKNNKVSITSKDLEIIEKFKYDMESEHKISFNSYLDKRTNKIYSSYTISITSNSLTKKLNKYIPVNKSDKFEIPLIDIKYYPDFLAGLIDGDGSFRLQNDKCKTLVVDITSTQECLSQIQNYLLNKFNIKKTKLQKVNKKNVWRLYIYSGALNFLNHIYNKNENMYLSRKQIKLKKIRYEKNNIC